MRVFRFIVIIHRQSFIFRTALNPVAGLTATDTATLPRPHVPLTRRGGEQR